MSSPSSPDVFALIGQSRSAVREGLVEPEPAPLPNVYLPLSGEESPRLANVEAATFERFREEIEELKSRFAPFAQPQRASLEPLRKRVSIGRATYRLEDGEAVVVTLPHYGGPIGRARGIYEMRVDLPESLFRQGRAFLCFQGVDYLAEVFVNGEFAGVHEGFFEPFEFDVTRIARTGGNTVRVVVYNDAAMHGNNMWRQAIDGDKIYAATGLGWDEPGLGWHHCPPGMGIWHEVFFESRTPIHLGDCWVRPLPESAAAEVHLLVHNTGRENVRIVAEGEVAGWNFPGEAVPFRAVDLPPTGPGLTQFRVVVPLGRDFRWWSGDEPFLYEARLRIASESGGEDCQSVRFGMRSFLLTDSPAPAGRIFLNGQEIRLRGANTMGHEQQCVLKGDWKQLREDILIAKHCGLNFLRFTQRPVSREIYDVCDELGMMAQSDLPIFTRVRRTKAAEAFRQAGAMERLIRRHPSSVLVSFINEPFPFIWGDCRHRSLDRSELEMFLSAASLAVRLENPDRQIKPIDGDYDPPGPGLPDNHCYTTWYCGHELDLGKLHKGYWRAVKPGWHYACGEFGAEGLDFADLMRRRYPADWLPASADEEREWTPSRIAYAQTGPMHALWMDPQPTLEDWVRTSQAHQAWAVRWMVRAFRRDSRMVSFAVHLLIDAFPAGWMKTLVDCERRPKPAYFEYRTALQPLLVDLRLDRWAWWGGETLQAEAWLCNDRHEVPAGLIIKYGWLINGEGDDQAGASGQLEAQAPSFGSTCRGVISFVLPEVNVRTEARLCLTLADAAGGTISETEEAITIFPRAREIRPPRLVILSEASARVSRLLTDLGTGEPAREETVFVTDSSIGWDAVLPQVAQGATLVALELAEGKFQVKGEKIQVEAAGYAPRHFVSRATGHPLVEGFEAGDFRLSFDASLDRISPLLDTLFLARDWSPILRTEQSGWGRDTQPAHACAEKAIGQGRIIICQYKLLDRTVANPTADRFARRLLGFRRP